MRLILPGLFLATLVSLASPARADIHDANAMMDGLKTRVVSSKGVKEVASMPAWIKSELARQTAANKKDKKAAKISKISKDKKAVAAKTTVRAITVSQLKGPDTIENQVVATTGYTPRSYYSQHYMPYSGHVSRLEPETDYREDYADYQ